MKIVITKIEMIAIANTIDVIIGCSNVVDLQVNPATTRLQPRDQVKKLEDWLNSKINNNIVDTKVVVITVIPVLKNIVISVDPAFISEFLTLYNDMLMAVIPSVVKIVSAVTDVIVIAENESPKYEVFIERWFKKPVIEEVEDVETLDS